MIKQCCYCRRIFANEEDHPPSVGAAPAAGLWVLPGARRETRVSHGICAECFEAKLAALREDSRRLAPQKGAAPAPERRPASA